jgi:hypothetical protein
MTYHHHHPHHQHPRAPIGASFLRVSALQRAGVAALAAGLLWGAMLWAMA